MRIKKTISVLLCAAVLLMSGCTAAPKKTKTNIIAASFYPVYIFTLNVTDGIESLDVRCMAQQNVGCLHDYTLTARDAKLLSDADVLVANGAGMESFTVDLNETAEDTAVVDSSKGIELLCAVHHHFDEDGEHSHETAHEHGDNAHIWMSVENAKKQVRNIADGLALVYPEYAKQFNENCESYIKRLESLQNEMKKTSAELKESSVITFHNAYDYLAADMGFEILTTIESDEGGEPSAKRLSQLSDEIRRENVKALFIEPNYKGSAATILSQETGVQIYTLNPVLNGENKKTAYEDIMRENIKIIIKAVK